MKTVFALLVMVLCFFSVSYGYEVNVRNGSPEEVVMANNAAKDAYDFFKKHGYVGDYDVNIEFKPEVYYGDIRVYGFFERESKAIQVTKFSDPWIKERLSFGLPVTETLHRSIVMHEVVHFLLQKVSGGIDGHGVHEYVAYSAQIMYLPEKTRQEVLNHYNTKAFRYDSFINSVRHAFQPHKFGVESYLHFIETDGSLVTEIVNKEFNPDRDFDVSVL